MRSFHPWRGAELRTLGFDVVTLHELLHQVLAHPDTACQQRPSDAPRPAVSATGVGMHGLDMDQQCIVTEVPTLQCGAKKGLLLQRSASLAP